MDVRRQHSGLIPGAAVFTELLGPLADNGGPTQTHALLPGSMALDGGSTSTGPTSCPVIDQRGETRPVDSDGDGTAICDAGAFEQQTPLSNGIAPAISAFAPSSVPPVAGAPVRVFGTGFVAGSVVHLNGSPRSTTVLSSTTLLFALSGADVLTGDLGTVAVTVVNPMAPPSNTLALTLRSVNVSAAHSVFVPPGTSGTAASLATAVNQASVSATLHNNGAATSAATVTVATYAVNPTGGTIFAAGGTFDVQVTGADATDSVDVRYYYPITIIGATEAALRLRYWTGTAWADVIGSGGAVPSKDTTNNLDGTLSGGRFAVTLAATSTPSITQLSGTVFALDVVNEPEPAKLSAVITAKAGPQNARAWTVTLSNGGPGHASAARVDGLTLTQTSGAACTPTMVSAFPVAVGDITSGGSAAAPVTIDFTGCVATARFTVNIRFSANAGAATGTMTLYNQYR
jgi:hypothetical protein